MDKSRPTIGLFAGIFDREGKILLKKIEEGVYGGKYDLPGGAIYLDDAVNALDERLIGEALRKHLQLLSESKSFFIVPKKKICYSLGI